jgi:hypothetical protein
MNICPDSHRRQWAAAAAHVCYGSCLELLARIAKMKRSATASKRMA